MKVDVAVLGSPSLIIFTVSVDVKQHLTCTLQTNSEVRSCVKVDGAVLDVPDIIVLMVSVDVKQH